MMIRSRIFTADKKMRNRKQRSKFSFLLSSCLVVNMTKNIFLYHYAIRIA